MKSSLLKVLYAGLMSAMMVPLAYAANPASTNTTTSQGLQVTIAAPAGPVLLDGSPINVSSSATLGAVPPTPVNLLYVTDLSGSMELVSNGSQVVGDCNQDGHPNTRLDAACYGLIALNNAVMGSSGVHVGIIGFGNHAVNADMDPAAGSQPFTSPANADNDNNGIPDVDQVVRSMRIYGYGTYGIGVFTPIPTIQIGGSTNYESALDVMNQTFSTRPTGEVNIAAFISDGQPNLGDFTAPLNTAKLAGTVIYTFAVGPDATTECNSSRPLGIIAAETGGTCTVVSDPSTLQSILPEVLTTRIQSLDLQVNGTTVASTSGSEPMSMALTNVDINSYLNSGNNTITSTATAEDGTSVTADVALEAHRKIAVQINVNPNSINLGSNGVVTATVFGNQDFDANSVVTDSVRLGNAPIATRNNGTLMLQYKDVNGDGYPDLIAKFHTQDLGISSNATSVTLTGTMPNGDIIVGSDSIKIVP